MKTKYCKASGTGGRNQPKSLSGIETGLDTSLAAKQMAGINLNPYQGLKRTWWLFINPGIYAGINLNPYQGLKLPLHEVSVCVFPMPEST